MTELPGVLPSVPILPPDGFKVILKGIFPPNFFPLMALYIGSNQLGGIHWTQRYDPEGVAAQVARTQEVLSWYKNFSRVIPTWYREHPPE